MGKRFVKIRYPKAYAVKANYSGIINPWRVYNYHGGNIMKGSAKTEKEAWTNLKNIIKQNEKETKGMTDEEIETRRLRLINKLSK